MILVHKSPIHDRGVFATRRIYPGTVVEQCPALVFPNKACPPDLNAYVAQWAKGSAALMLGKCSLLNHSENANVRLEGCHKHREMRIIATRRIEKDEELLLNYGFQP